MVIVILALIGVGAYFVYSKFLLPQALDVSSENDINLDLNIDYEDESNGAVVEDNPILEDTEDLTEGDLEDPVVDEENNNLPEDGDLAFELLKNIDTDNDGLSDYDELYVYNTDPYNPDTDGDGLSDYEEIMIFGADPLNPDTDGDGFLDGEETLNCYSPLVAGEKIDLDLLENKQLFSERFPELMEKCNLSL